MNDAVSVKCSTNTQNAKAKCYISDQFDIRWTRPHITSLAGVDKDDSSISETDIIEAGNAILADAKKKAASGSVEAQFDPGDGKFTLQEAKFIDRYLNWNLEKFYKFSGGVRLTSGCESLIAQRAIAELRNKNIQSGAVATIDDAWNTLDKDVAVKVRFAVKKD